MTPVSTVLSCAACGTSADLRTGPHAWDGWTLAPKPACPTCNGTQRYCPRCRRPVLYKATSNAYQCSVCEEILLPGEVLDRHSAIELSR